MTPMERFRSKVNYDGPLPEKHPEAGPCHLWTASTFDSGYGQLKVARKNVRVHRWLWQQERGPLTPDQVLDHWACERHDCVNLDHLRPVTNRENVLRSDTSWAARNRAKTHCPQDHPYAGDNLRVRESDNARICLTCTRAKDREHKRQQRARLAAQGLTSRGTPRR